MELVYGTQRPAVSRELFETSGMTRLEARGRFVACAGLIAAGAVIVWARYPIEGAALAPKRQPSHQF